MNDEKQLDKIDIASELKILSPIEARSIELMKEADAVEITDKVSYGAAKKIKKELISHRTKTKDLRLTFTRKLDNLKDQFIKKQDEVLEAALAGEAIVKGKVADWEKLEQERKDAEIERINAIITKISNVWTSLDRKKSTLEDIKRTRAALKMERGLLDTADRNKVAIKNIVSDVNAVLDEYEQFIIDRIEQERVAEEQRVEAEKLAAERKALEDEKVTSGKERELLERSKLPPINLAEREAALKATELDETAANLVGVDMGIPEGDKSVIEDVVNNVAKVQAAEFDLTIQRFLADNGVVVDLKNVEATRLELIERGYKLDVSYEQLEPQEGEFTRKKTTFTLSRIMDTYSYETVGKLGE